MLVEQVSCLEKIPNFRRIKFMNDITFDNRVFEVTRAGDSLNESDLTTFEAKLGIKLPQQLREYYLNYNGGLPAPLDIPEDDTVWVRLKWKQGVDASRVGPAAGLEYLLLIDANPARDFLRTYGDFKHRIPADCLCFARNAGGSLFLIGIGQHNLGRIFFWARSFEADIEGGESVSYDNIADVADSFNEFMAALRGEPKPDESLEDWEQRVYPE